MIANENNRAASKEKKKKKSEIVYKENCGNGFAI